jgi:hypothetical protein
MFKYHLNKFFSYRIPPIITYLLIPIIQIILIYYNVIIYFSEICFIIFVILNFIFELNTEIFYKSDNILINKIDDVLNISNNNFNDLKTQLDNFSVIVQSQMFFNQIDNNYNSYKFPKPTIINTNKKIIFINDDDLQYYNKLTIIDKLMFYGFINSNYDDTKININFNYCNSNFNNLYDKIIIYILFLIYFLGITPRIFILDINKICNKN